MLEKNDHEKDNQGLIDIHPNPSQPSSSLSTNGDEREAGVFQCKGCNKTFDSHQALGGHRASHKRVKGCFAAKIDGEDHDTWVGEDQAEADGEKGNNKMHECSVCRRVFSSGQALGGHKRSHWHAATAAAAAADSCFAPNSVHLVNRGDRDVDLNLNIGLSRTTTWPETRRRRR